MYTPFPSVSLSRCLPVTGGGVRGYGDKDENQTDVLCVEEMHDRRRLDIRVYVPDGPSVLT